MSIRDIIEVAADGGWIHEGDEVCSHAYPCDVAFILAFTPEHVALMEAERVAARVMCMARSSYELEHAINWHEYDAYAEDYYWACAALTAFRRERGLL